MATEEQLRQAKALIEMSRKAYTPEVLAVLQFALDLTRNAEDAAKIDALSDQIKSLLHNNKNLYCFCSMFVVFTELLLEVRDVLPIVFDGEVTVDEFLEALLKHQTN